jgi:hypothetical protein
MLSWIVLRYCSTLEQGFVLSDKYTSSLFGRVFQSVLSSQFGARSLVTVEILLICSLFIDRADVCMTQTPAEAACDAAVVQVRRIATAVAG